MDTKHHDKIMEATQAPGAKTKRQEPKQKKKIQELRAPMQAYSAMGPEQNFLEDPKAWSKATELAKIKLRISASTCTTSSERKRHLGCVVGYLAHGCGY